MYGLLTLDMTAEINIVKNIIKTIENRYITYVNPMRGFRDFESIVTFNDSSDDEQLAEMKKLADKLASSSMHIYAPEPVSKNVWRNYGYGK